MIENLACSSLAWSVDRDLDATLRHLKGLGYAGVEVAPTNVWGSWEQATPAAALAYRQRLADHGFVVPAMQAIFFGVPQVHFFDTPEAIEAHLLTVARLAEQLTCPVLVFGAPKLRTLKHRSPSAAFETAVSLCQRWAALCQDHGTTLCLEPNPRTYGCEFVYTARQAKALVAAVNHPGFGLHLDAAAMFMEGEVGPVVLRDTLASVRHFHVSEPGLAGLAMCQVDHLANLLTLATGDYPHWVSLETVDTRQFEASTRQLADWIELTREAANAYA